MPDEQPKRIEVTPEQLRALLNKPENKAVVSKHLNRYDQNLAAFRLRDTTAEVYQQRGTNVQQNAIMQGFMRWQGTLHKMSHNLVVGLNVSLGGIKPTALAMHEKNFLERNAPAIIILGSVLLLYMGTIYSPDFRAEMTAFLEPITTRIFLGVFGLVALILYYRSKKRKDESY